MAYILASKSPRRKELLKRIIDDFQVIDSNIVEKVPANLKSSQVPVYLALQKAKAVFAKYPGDTIIACDTVVIIENNILGKPKDRNEVKEMITKLSGKTHVVVSGVCLIKKGKIKTFNCKTHVTFEKMNAIEIENYAKTADVLDKAGAYGIQNEASVFIKEIKGDYYNVVGLPLSKLYKKLSDF